MIIDAPCYDDIPALRSLWKEAFGDGDAFLDGFFSTAFSPDRSACAKESGNLLGMLYWFDCEYDGGRVAYIYAVATAKAYRGRGICSALLKETHIQLEKKGYTGAVLVPYSEELFAFYEKFGYKRATFVNEFSVSALPTNLYIEKIGKEKYAELRRKFMPIGSVVQEKENIDFLSIEAELYAGDTFLLAARREGKKLRGIELLGDTDKASEITYALGATEGNFRTPGEKKPFAMYLLFDKTKKTPSYFGFAFD